MKPMKHSDLYRNELTDLGYGIPIWEPSPSTLYDRVRIGDVGHFHNNQFLPLFNIIAPSDPNRRLPFPQPTDFPPLRLPEDCPTIQNRNPLQAGVYALECSLTFSASVGFDSTGSVLNGESSLSFNNEKGAALILPYEASREDTLHDELFRTHMLRYYGKWCEFANKKCHRNIKPYDLILVTGCDMTRQWATATYNRRSGKMSAALGAQVAPVAEAKFSLSAGWTKTQPVITRRGPPQALHQQNRPDDNGTQNDSETQVNNQCIFLRCFYMEGQILGGPKIMKAGAGYHDPGKYGPDEEGVEGVLANKGVAVETLLPSTQDQSYMTVLLDYMLEESDADVVIANDSDRWPYLGEVENPDSHRDTLKSTSPTIKVEDGVGSLVSQDSCAYQLDECARPEDVAPSPNPKYLHIEQNLNLEPLTTVKDQLQPQPQQLSHKFSDSQPPDVDTKSSIIGGAYPFAELPPHIFVLIIEINKYESRRISNLERAVPDADAIQNYLQNLGVVPSFQIRDLRYFCENILGSAYVPHLPWACAKVPKTDTRTFAILLLSNTLA